MKTCLSCLLLLFCLCSAQAKTRKAVYIVLDGIPADYIERVRPTHIFDIARQGGYARAYTGGEVGGYSQTPTISAIGYMNILTGTWMNKHRVNGNSNLKPNYNYWSIFRLAKAQKKPCKTALFSSWTDNRTVLIGAGKPETGNLAVDYVYDGYELDEARFPPRPDQLTFSASTPLSATRPPNVSGVMPPTSAGFICGIPTPASISSATVLTWTATSARPTSWWASSGRLYNIAKPISTRSGWLS